MSDRDIMHLLERADAADKRMQHLQEQIDRLRALALEQETALRSAEHRITELSATLAPRHP